MRVLVLFAAALALGTSVSGCARQAVYYSSFPDYPPPAPGPYGSPQPYDYSYENVNGYYGSPPPYEYSYENGYFGGPYAYGYGYGDWPTSSSTCWEPLRGRMPCNSAGP